MMKTTKPSKRIISSKPEVLPFFTAVFILGLKLSQLVSIDLSALLFFLSIGCVIISLIYRSNAKVLLPILALGTIFSGAFYGNLRIHPEIKSGELILFDQSSGVLSGTFTGEYRALKSGGVSLYMKNCQIETASQSITLPGRVYVRAKDSNLIPEPEQIYSGTGTLRFKLAQRTPAFHCKTLTHQGYETAFNALGGKIQRHLRDGLNIVLPTRHATIVTGFLLGDTSRINFKDKKLFRETGISHLMAVSGQHIMVLSLVIAACLHGLRVPPISRTIFICVFLFLYAFTTSGSPSIIRALLMYIVTATIFHLESSPAPIRPISIAALLILIYDPGYISNAAFILSFTAVASIIVLRPMLEYYLKRLHLPQLLARYIAVTFAANIGVLPMAAFLFGTVSIAAIFVNPAIVWLFSVILPISFILGIVSAISPGYGLFIAPGLSLPLDGLLSFLEKVNSLPGTFFFIGNTPGLLTAVIYGGLLLWAGFWNRRMLLQGSSSEEKVTFSINNNKQNEEISSSIRVPENSHGHCTRKLEAGSSKFSVSGNFTKDFQNIFKDSNFLSDVDSMMVSSKRRSLKHSAKSDSEFPIKLLCLDNQNLFHQIMDIDLNVIEHQNDRLIQAQVLLLALAGGEIVNRISVHLNPPPDPSEVKIELVIKDRFLALAVLGDRLLSSSLLTRTSNDQFILLMSRGRTLIARGRNQLQRMMEKYDAESIEQHFSLRRDLLAWCQEFIEFDLEWRKTNI